MAGLLLAVPAHASEPTPFVWPSHQQIPQRISDGAVALNLSLDAWESLYRTSKHERLSWACRTGLTVALAETVKRLVHRTRPNGSDEKSFFSEHTALATTAAGYKAPWGASFALTAAWGRQAAGMHYASDVSVGFGVGLFSKWVCE